VNVRLLVVEPEVLRRRLVCESALCVADVEVIGVASSLQDEAVLNAVDPEIILVDASLVENERGALIEVAQRHAGAYFVLFGAYADLDALLFGLPVPLRGYLS